MPGTDLNNILCTINYLILTTSCGEGNQGAEPLIKHCACVRVSNSVHGSALGEMGRARSHASSELRHLNQTWGQKGFLEDMFLSGLTLSHEHEQETKIEERNISRAPSQRPCSLLPGTLPGHFISYYSLPVHLSKLNCELLVIPRLSGSFL